MNDDLDFERRFRETSIPHEEWTHEAHLRMAFLTLRRHPFADGVRRMRRGIRRLNRAHGVVDSDTRGYHETLTLAWAHLVAAGLTGLEPDVDFAAFRERNSDLMRRDRVLEHYSRERIFSMQARREFVLPDRAPLPAVPTCRVRNRSLRRKDSGVEATDTASRPTGPSPRRTRS